MKRLRRFALMAVAALMVAGCGGIPTPNSNGPGAAPTKIPPLPSSPIELNVLDVAGGSQLTQGMFDNYLATHPKLVSKINVIKATAPELASKIKAQQQGGNVQTDIVLTGSDGLAAGVDQNLWIQLMPAYSQKFPNLETNYLPAAEKMYQLGKGNGLLFSYTPSGPFIEYSSKVSNPPTNPQELLDWAKAHPKQFEYARPANSGPGRTLLQGLPYLLGDKDPKEPVNGWDKTWAYLKQLDQYIDYYPTGTSVTMKDLGNGTRTMIASTMGWDINPRVLGTVPKDAKVGLLQTNNFHWLSDSQYMVVPRGLSDDHLAVTLDFLAFMLTPEQQAVTYDKGYFYPGPAVKGVTLSMAPASSQSALKDFIRPEFDGWIKKYPVEIALDTNALNAAFDKWDREIGGGGGRYHG